MTTTSAAERAEHIPGDSFEEATYRELVRSRRHERPLSLLVLVGERPAAAARWRRRGAGRAALAARAAAHVRRYDYVSTQDAAGRVAILAPEQSADGARTMAERLARLLHVPAGAASFPQDGTSVAELVDVATARAASPADREVSV